MTASNARGSASKSVIVHRGRN